jgi:hypothetical protein
VRVAPEDLERADALLARPISADIRAGSGAMLHAPDFQVPACSRRASEGSFSEVSWIAGAGTLGIQDEPKLQASSRSSTSNSAIAMDSTRP